MIDSTQP